MRLPTDRTGIVISILLILISLYVIGVLVERSDKLQWDFRSYYIAAQYHSEGHDPYDITSARYLVGVTVHPFIYPPLTLYVFQTLAYFDYDTAYLIWLTIKVVLAIILLIIWRKMFVTESPGWPFYLFVLLGFGATMYTDLKAGNISIVEQAAIWAGFYFLLKDRVLLFCLCILFVSLFKGLPMVLLLLLLLFRTPQRWNYIMGSVLLYVAINILDYWLHPDLYARYLNLISSLDERGAAFNPSTFAFIKDVIGPTVHLGVSIGLVQLMSGLVYVGLVAFVFYLTATFFWKPLVAEYRRIEAADGQFWRSRDFAIPALYMATLVYALVMPRFKIYSFIMILPAAWYVMRRLFALRDSGWIAFLLLFILLSLSSRTSLPISSSAVEGFFDYFQLFTAWLVWGIMLWMARRQPFLADKFESSLSAGN